MGKSKSSEEFKLDLTKVEWDGTTIRLIVKDEAALIRKLKRKQKEIMKDLKLKRVSEHE